MNHIYKIRAAHLLVDNLRREAINRIKSTNKTHQTVSINFTDGSKTLRSIFVTASKRNGHVIVNYGFRDMLAPLHQVIGYYIRASIALSETAAARHLNNCAEFCWAFDNADYDRYVNMQPVGTFKYKGDIYIYVPGSERPCRLYFKDANNTHNVMTYAELADFGFNNRLYTFKTASSAIEFAKRP